MTSIWPWEKYVGVDDDLCSDRRFKKKDLEVLLFEESLDEHCIGKLADFDGKKFVSIQSADLKVDETEEEKKYFSRVVKMYEPLTSWFKTTLKDLTDNGAYSMARWGDEALRRRGREGGNSIAVRYKYITKHSQSCVWRMIDWLKDDIHSRVF